MKITKIQLKQIIKEERAKLLSESNDAHHWWVEDKRNQRAQEEKSNQEAIERVALDLKQTIYLPQYKIPTSVLWKIEQLLRMLGVAK